MHNVDLVANIDGASKARLFAALAKAQAQMGRAHKDSVNPAFRSKYVSLPAVLDAVLPAFNANGLAVLQHPLVHDDVSAVTLTTVITHESGEYMTSTCTMPVGGKRDAHAVGSAISYMRRYALASIAGVIQDDDDGNGASGQQQQQQQQAAPRMAASPPRPQAAPEKDEEVVEQKATSVRGQGAPAAQVQLDEGLLRTAISPFNLALLSDYCIAKGKPSPVDMLPHQQRMMIEWVVNGPGAKVVLEWRDAEVKRIEAAVAAEKAAEAAAVQPDSALAAAGKVIDNQAVMDAINDHVSKLSLNAKAILGEPPPAARRTRARAAATDGGAS
jgi:ERF superfamily